MLPLPAGALFGAAESGCDCPVLGTGLILTGYVSTEKRRWLAPGLYYHTDK